MGGPGGTTLAVLVAGIFLLSGCVESGLDPGEETSDSPEDSLRIGSFSMSGTGGSSCPAVSSIPDLSPCLELDAGLTGFRCDPPQLMARTFDRPDLIELVSEADHGEITGPGGHWVYCEYALIWTATARSLVPGSEFVLAAQLQEDRLEASCEIEANGECTIQDHLEGNFTIMAPGEQVEIQSHLHGRIEGFELGIVSLDGDVSMKTRIRLQS